MPGLSALRRVSQVGQRRIGGGLALEVWYLGDGAVEPSRRFGRLAAYARASAIA